MFSFCFRFYVSVKNGHVEAVDSTIVFLKMHLVLLSYWVTI